MPPICNISLDASRGWQHIYLILTDPIHLLKPAPETTTPFRLFITCPNKKIQLKIVFDFSFSFLFKEMKSQGSSFSVRPSEA